MARMPRPPATPDADLPGVNAVTEPSTKAEVVAAPRLELCVEREAGKPANRSMVLDGDFIRVGSHPSNDLVLADRAVSRFHCILERVRSTFRLTDVGSRNGTWVGALRVSAAYLVGGEVVRVGETAIQVDLVTNGRRDAVPSGMRFGRLIGASREMRRLYPVLERLARTDVAVVIEGETGTGKEMLAEALHDASSRKAGPFVIFDCTAVPPNLVESETNRALVACARRTCVLVDHTKFGVIGLSTFLDLDQVDVLVTDDALSARARTSVADAVGTLMTTTQRPGLCAPESHSNSANNRICTKPVRDTDIALAIPNNPASASTPASSGLRRVVGGRPARRRLSYHTATNPILINVAN